MSITGKYNIKLRKKVAPNCPAGTLRYIDWRDGQGWNGGNYRDVADEKSDYQV